MAAVVIKSKQTGDVKLSPAPLVPAATFKVSNNLNVDIKVTTEGRTIKVEPA